MSFDPEDWGTIHEDTSGDEAIALIKRLHRRYYELSHVKAQGEYEYFKKCFKDWVDEYG